MQSAECSCLDLIPQSEIRDPHCVGYLSSPKRILKTVLA
jgi:hypothetical protein